MPSPKNRHIQGLQKETTLPILKRPPHSRQGKDGDQVLVQKGGKVFLYCKVQVHWLSQEFGKATTNTSNQVVMSGYSYDTGWFPVNDSLDSNSLSDRNGYYKIDHNSSCDLVRTEIFCRFEALRDGGNDYYVVNLNSHISNSGPNASRYGYWVNILDNNTVELNISPDGLSILHSDMLSDTSSNTSTLISSNDSDNVGIVEMRVFVYPITNNKTGAKAKIGESRKQRSKELVVSSDGGKISTGKSVVNNAGATVDGTKNSTFTIDSDGTGILLKNDSGVLHVRDKGDDNDAKINAKFVQVTGEDTSTTDTLALSAALGVPVIRGNGFALEGYVNPALTNGYTQACATNSSSSTITCAAANTSIKVGHIPTGTGIPSGKVCYVGAITESGGAGTGVTSFTLHQDGSAVNATATNDPVTLTFQTATASKLRVLSHDHHSMIAFTTSGTNNPYAIGVDIREATHGVNPNDAPLVISQGVSDDDFHTNRRVVMHNSGNVTFLKNLLLTSTDGETTTMSVADTSGIFTIATAASTAADADIVLDAGGGIYLDADNGVCRLIDGGSAFTPAHADDITTKAYVDAIKHTAVWGGNLGRVGGSGTWLGIPTGYTAATLQMGSGSSPDVSFTCDTEADDLVACIWASMHDITVIGCKIWTGPGGATNTAHSVSLMRYEIDADGDLSSGVEVGALDSIANDDYHHARAHTLICTKTNVDFSNNEILIAFVEPVAAYNAALACKVILEYTEVET